VEETARRVPFDLGVADGAWGQRYSVEGVGGGLMSIAIADMDKRSDGDELPTPSKVTGAVRTIGRVLSRFKPAEWTEDHRDELARYLRDLLDGRDIPPWLTSQRARHVTLEGPTDVHVDDELLSTRSRQMSTRVKAAPRSSWLDRIDHVPVTQRLYARLVARH
jgi:hypothetical protein